MIRKLFNKYSRYNPEKWEWEPYVFAHNCSLEEQKEWNELYLKTRARKNSNEDKIIPDYSSIERDANQFDLKEVIFTDIFGLKWSGKKGCMEEVKEPDYERSLYYFDEEYDEVCISDYNDDNKPEEDIYECFELGYPRFRKEWIDIKNIENVEYKYIVENHLFKDSKIEYFYNDNKDIIYDIGIRQFVKALKKFGKNDLYEKLIKQINKHFSELKNSDNEDERRFYPGCTAEEYFKE